jgi:hypothetical protein
MPTADNSHTALIKRRKGQLLARVYGSTGKELPVSASAYLDRKQGEQSYILQPSGVVEPCCSCPFKITWLSSSPGISLTFNGIDASGFYNYSAPYAIVETSLLVNPLFGPPPIPETEISVGVSGSTYTVRFKTAAPITSSFLQETGFIFACPSGDIIEGQNLIFIPPP